MYTKLSGIDQSDAEILKLPVYTYIVSSSYPFHKDHFVKRNGSFHPSYITSSRCPFFRQVKYPEIQLPFYSHMVIRYLYLVNYHRSSIHDQPCRIRSGIRDNYIVFQSHLGLSLTFHTIHMYIPFYQLHKNTSLNHTCSFTYCKCMIWGSKVYLPACWNRMLWHGSHWDYVAISAFGIL